jgi:SPP1 gp7 family putative phage head morphogenesis protein
MLAIPHDQATALIAGKPEVTRDVWDQLHPDLQARAFTITGVECLDTLANVRELIATLPSGGDYDDIKDTIFEKISPFLVDPNASEEDQLKQTRAANRRAEMLLRLHGWTSYAQTQHALAEAHIDVFPFRQYLSSEDSRVRPAHAALNKKILPANHPFWQNHTPPWEFNCRCDMVVMTKDDVDAISASEAKLPDEDKKVLPASQLNQIATQKRIVKPGGQGFLDIRTPREKGGGKGYEFRPGDNNLPLEQILERFTPSEKSIFQSWAATVQLSDGRTLADYWSLTPANKPAAVKAAKTKASSAKNAGPKSPKKRKSPVSNKLTPNRTTKDIITRVGTAIDAVHDDGILPVIPVDGSAGSGNNGVYVSTWDGKADHISVKATGQWPHMTAIHEIGHFLDHQALGSKPGKWATEDKDGPLKDVLATAKASDAYAKIQSMAPRSRQAYLSKNKEIWARAYAQYVASQSTDPLIIADLKKAQSISPYLQWQDDDFQPIATEITKAFTTLKWL